MDPKQKKDQDPSRDRKEDPREDSTDRRSDREDELPPPEHYPPVVEYDD